jgi:asparagine synthase (glutamine-hydrolysing)
MFDGLRVDRTLAAHGLEARVPFLDPDYITTYLSTPAEWRQPSYQNKKMEKHLLREAFATLYPDILPHDILWRQKEAFSDAVSKRTKSWYQILQEHIETAILDDEFEAYKQECQHLSPVSKESYYYRRTFEEMFGKQSCGVLKHFWLPQWCANTIEPSARALSKELATMQK